MPACLHDLFELLDIGSVSTLRAEEEHPVLHTKLPRGERYGLHLYAGILIAPRLHLAGRREQDHVRNAARLGPILGLELSELSGVVIGKDHGRKFWRIVHTCAVMEYDTSQWGRQLIDRRELFERGLDHGSYGVALAGALHAEEAYGVAFVKV